MPNYSLTVIIGHVGHTPEVKYLPNGDAVTNLSVAVTESWKDKATGDKKENTTWYRVNAFGKLAEIIGKYVNKGDPVMITGKMQSRKYTGKDGVEKESWELRANELQMLGGKRDQSEPVQQAHNEAKKDGYQPGSTKDGGFQDMADEIPFAGMRGKMLNCI